MKTEAGIRSDILHAMEIMQKNKETGDPPNHYTYSRLDTLKDVLEQEDDFFVLPCEAYKSEDIRLVVAIIQPADDEKEEVGVEVNLYDRDGNMINETIGGWLVSQFEDLEGMPYKRCLSRKLFVPNLNVCLNWNLQKDDLIKDGKPIAVWKDPEPDAEYVTPDEVINWTNIETGEALEVRR